MHGPGGPHGGGPHGGGPHGGGPHGGPGFGGGPGMRGGYGYKHPGPIKPAAGGYVATGDTFVDRYFAQRAKQRENFRDIGYNSRLSTKLGRSLRGLIGASRMNLTGGMHYDVFQSKVEAADKLLKKEKISELVCKYRKLKAASKYFEYLFKVGKINKEEYRYEMDTYAKSIGVTQEKDYDAYLQVMDEEPEKLRSR